MDEWIPEYVAFPMESPGIPTIPDLIRMDEEDKERLETLKDMFHPARGD